MKLDPRSLSVLFCLTLWSCAAGPAHSPDDHEVCEDGVCPLPAELAGIPTVETGWVVEDMDGGRHDVDAALASGRRVVFVFWQTWCGSCRAEFPGLIAAAERYESQLDFIGVISGPDEAVDDPEVRAVVAQYGLTYPQVRDRDLTLTRRYEVTGTPTIAIVGAKRETLYLDHHAPESWADYTR